MEEQLIKKVMKLCEKLSNTLDKRDGRIADLERKVAALERRQKPSYSFSEAAKLTGWSVATISKWAKSGKIATVPGMGKNLRVATTEIDNIINLKGRGPSCKRTNY